MAREAKCRRVAAIPPVKAYKPVGVPVSCLEEVVLKVEEAEAIRLKSHLNLEQEECARMMQVSRPTFQRILSEAYAKIADALTNGKGIRIEGGSYCLGNGFCRRRGKKLAPMENCEYFDAGLELPELKKDRKLPGNLLAVAALGTSTASQLGARFGQCTYFWLWNPDTDEYSLLQKTHAEGTPASGTDSAQELIKAGVGSVIVNHIGPKAFMILQRANINVYSGAEGKTVSEALNMFRSGQLYKMESADN
ncbi:MAG TPA: DUF134 domain-containing protein [Syntrophomonadaceae bacterium]|nr:DUF134 domain-containing protein [Syntrophomonadaceae bacterium]HPR94388.1 DUF134 domain-containing protein [Syntrophomonadaceae bacterium]